MVVALGHICELNLKVNWNLVCSLISRNVNSFLIGNKARGEMQKTKVGRLSIQKQA